MPTAVINKPDVRLQLAGQRLQALGRKREALCKLAVLVHK